MFCDSPSFAIENSSSSHEVSRTNHNTGSMLGMGLSSLMTSQRLLPIKFHIAPCLLPRCSAGHSSFDIPPALQRRSRFGFVLPGGDYDLLVTDKPVSASVSLTPSIDISLRMSGNSLEYHCLGFIWYTSAPEKVLEQCELPDLWNHNPEAFDFGFQLSVGPFSCMHSLCATCDLPFEVLTHDTAHPDCAFVEVQNLLMGCPVTIRSFCLFIEGFHGIATLIVQLFQSIDKDFCILV